MERGSDKMADQIKKLIFSRTLKPGDRLPSEREIALQFGTGRMVVREALRILEQSGLIYIKQGKGGGAHVKAFDITHTARSFSDAVRRSDVALRDLVEVRSATERTVIALAIERMDENDIGLLRENIKNTKETVLKGGLGWGQFVDFHLLVARATRNQLYEMVVESLVTIMRTFAEKVSPDLFSPKDHLRQHREIYDAIRTRDVTKAQDKMESHIRWHELCFNHPVANHVSGEEIKKEI
jgi:GntR family transcriptional regulator, transcriptional repressor for pyruvate dehydrogenase complex